MQARIVASLTEFPDEERLTRLSDQVDVLEVRADLVKDVEPSWLRQHFSGDLLFTLRSRDQGGCSDASDDTRRQRILEVAGEFDLIDLELSRDLVETVLEAVEPSKRIVSWHGPHSGLSQLQSTFDRMSQHRARYYKLVPSAERSHHEMSPLALLHSIRRDDVIAFASGPIGSWTRLIAPRLGAPVVYASAGSEPAAPGQLSVDQLIRDFHLPDLNDVTHLYGLVGDRIEHSLSPRMHNNLYRMFGIEALYLPFQVEEFGDFWIEIVESGSFEELGFELKGLSVTSPHKEIASAVAGARSPLVDLIGSANTLIFHEDVWEAESTDGAGVIGALTEAGAPIAGVSAAVLGVGGAGRSAAVALRRAGAAVTLINRDPDRGRSIARQLRMPFRAMEGFDPEGFQVVVHATPLGSDPHDELPFEPTRLDRESVLVDLVYTESGPTPLVREARSVARIAVDGRVPLLHQARPQFYMMTGFEPEIEDLRRLTDL